MIFTDQQLRDFEAYEKVQLSNRYNMLDPRARHAAGLDNQRYVFVMNNYDALAKAAEAWRAAAKSKV